MQDLTPRYRVLKMESLAKKDLLEMDGVVVEMLFDSRYRVILDNGRNLVAYSVGIMRKHHIHVIPGDKVTPELSTMTRAKPAWPSPISEGRGRPTPARQ